MPDVWVMVAEAAEKNEMYHGLCAQNLYLHDAVYLSLYQSLIYTAFSMCYPPLHKLPGVKDCIDSLANSFLMLFIRFETYTRGTYKYKQTNKQTNKHTNKQITIGNQNHTVCHSAREKKKKSLRCLVSRFYNIFPQDALTAVSSRLILDFCIATT